MDSSKHIPFFKSIPCLNTRYVIIMKTIVPIIDGIIRVAHTSPDNADETIPTPTINRYETGGPRNMAIRIL